jgi:hypothetical protein
MIRDSNLLHMVHILQRNQSQGIFYYYFSGVTPLGPGATTGLLYQPQMIDDGHCGAIGGIKIGRGNGSKVKLSLYLIN